MEGRPRALFLGMQGSFSLPSLHALLESGIEVCAVVLPGDQAQGLSSNQMPIYRREPAHPARSTLPVLNSSLDSSIVQLAWQRKIPLWQVHRLSDPVTVSTLTAYQPDVISVACFSQRIPRAILEIAPLGCLNVHPSLLPANRGPLPLFWTFRLGCKQTGVTIHFMDEGMDSGDILAQQAIPVTDGMSYAQLELESARIGGNLLCRTIWKLYEGSAISLPQDENKSSYHGFPDDEDFVVPVAEWDAAHVYNFICGVAEWSGPVTLNVGNEHITVQKAISYSRNNMCDIPSKNYCWRGEALWIRCKSGWVAVIQPITFQ